MKRVYTKTGDKGTTGIHGGMRVPKDDIRIEANGCLDELNAVIGIVRSMLSAEDSWQELLHAVQRELMVVMSHVATPSGVVNPNPLSAAELTLRCEQEMDAMTVLLTDNGYFLLPGGTPISAQLQFARTVARRAERRLWTLHRQIGADAEGAADFAPAMLLDVECLAKIERIAEDDGFSGRVDAQFAVAGNELVGEIEFIAGVAAYTVE